MSQIVDMTGQRFGKLTVIEKVEPNPSAKGALWRCLCDCGNETVALGNNIRRGHHKSCGCLRKGNMNRIRMQYLKNDPDWKKKVKESRKSTKCHYNDGCECDKRDCKRCGWNPKVAKARLEKMGYGN